MDYSKEGREEEGIRTKERGRGVHSLKEHNILGGLVGRSIGAFGLCPFSLHAALFCVVVCVCSCLL
jgi:hypothetical protein